MSPTYRLLIGVPGQEQRLCHFQKTWAAGIYQSEDAHKNMDKADQDFEDLLTDLESSRKTIETEREEIREI